MYEDIIRIPKEFGTVKYSSNCGIPLSWRFDWLKAEFSAYEMLEISPSNFDRFSSPNLSPKIATSGGGVQAENIDSNPEPLPSWTSWTFEPLNPWTFIRNINSQKHRRWVRPPADCLQTCLPIRNIKVMIAPQVIVAIQHNQGSLQGKTVFKGFRFPL